MHLCTYRHDPKLYREPYGNISSVVENYYCTVTTYSPKTVLCVILFLVQIRCFPFRLDIIYDIPKVKEEAGDFSCWRQKSSQISLEITGQSKASGWDDGHVEVQTNLQTTKVVTHKSRFSSYSKISFRWHENWPKFLLYDRFLIWAYFFIFSLVSQIYLLSE